MKLFPRLLAYFAFLCLLSPVLAYHLNVDGVQITDSNNTCAAFTALPPYSHLVVHGSGAAYCNARDVPRGLVTRHVHHSETRVLRRRLRRSRLGNLASPALRPVFARPVAEELNP